jgi:hypothetical protein
MRVFLLGPFRNAYAFRGVMVWTGLRFALLVVQITAVGSLTKVGILVVVGAAVYLDARRRDEDVFLGNLGVAGVWIAVAALPIPIVLEFFVL